MPNLKLPSSAKTKAIIHMNEVAKINKELDFFISFTSYIFIDLFICYNFLSQYPPLLCDCQALT